MSKRTVLFIISQVVIILVVWGIIKAAQLPNLENYRNGLKDRFTEMINYILDKDTPEIRKPPLVLDELEAYLITYLQEPFISFQRDDWNEFWKIIYGKFDQGSRGWWKKQRQLTKEEVQDELSDEYPRPFGYFGPGQWGIFWKEVLKGKVFK